MQTLFDELVEQRKRHEEAVRERARRIALFAQAQHARALPRNADPRALCDETLAAAGGRMTSFRRIANGAQLEVTYTVEGSRIVSLVDTATLQVIDPGVCLGHDGEYKVLTLDAMPSVIRQAIAERRLNIGRFY
jgi:hypothetical protein